VIFSNQNSFANGFNLDGGTIVFTANSVGGGTGGTAPTTSQIGTGTLTIADGTAIMGSAAVSIGNVVNVADSASFTFGTLATTNARANATNNLTLTNTVTLGTGAHTINVNGLQMTGTISGKLTGGTNFTKDGPGTLVLNNAANDFGGTIAINGGTLQHNVAGSIPSGRIMTVAAGAAFNMNAIGQSIDSLNGAGSVINPGANTTLTINGSTNGSFSGVIAATTAANLNVVKDGANTQTFSGANLYGGGTTVTNGKLLINNTTGSGTGTGTVSVAAGATLGGTGAIAGAINVTGALSPGASVESLVSGALTLNNLSTFVYEATSNSSTGADLMVANGTLSLTGVTLDLTGADLSLGSWFLNDKLTLISYTGADVTSGFTGYVDDTEYTFGSNKWTFNYNDLIKGNNYATDATGSRFVTVTKTGGTSSPYQTWIDSYGTIPIGDRDPEDDYDNDGVNNLGEFAFKGVPNDGSKRGVFYNEAKDNGDVDSDKELTFTCAVRRSASINFAANGNNAQVSMAPIDEVTYTIEGSPTLTGTWNSAVSYIGKSDTAPSGSGLPSLAGTDWEYRTFSGFNGMADKGFIRAKAEK
jgi:autotransporter-associated beta strand protein